MANSWIEALKIWNQQKGGVWCVPRKGSKAYDDVLAIMRGMGRRPVERKQSGTRAEIAFVDSGDEDEVERDDRPDDVRARDVDWEGKDARNREIREEAERIAEEFMAGLTFEEDEPEGKEERKLTKEEAVEEIFQLWYEPLVTDKKLSTLIENKKVNKLGQKMQSLFDMEGGIVLGPVLERARYLDRVNGDIKARSWKRGWGDDDRYIVYDRMKGYIEDEEGEDNFEFRMTDKARKAIQEGVQIYLNGLIEMFEIQEKAYKEIGLTTEEIKKEQKEFDEDYWLQTKSDLVTLSFRPSTFGFEPVQNEFERQLRKAFLENTGVDLKSLGNNKYEMVADKNYKQYHKKWKLLVKALLDEYKKRVKEIVKRTRK